MSQHVRELRAREPLRSVEQIARIAALLGELEDLSYGARHVPSPLLEQTRDSIEKARHVLKSCAQFADSAAPVMAEPLMAEDDEADPQPDVDRDILERLYRDLKIGRRTPVR